MDKGKKRLIVGGVVAGGLMLGAAGLVIGAGVAKADFHQDVQFMYLLDSHGIELPHNDTSWGQGVCKSLDAGYTPNDTIEYVYTHSPLSHDKSMWFSASALEVYCPWRDGQGLYESRPSSGRMHTIVPNEAAAYAEKRGKK